ncbi:VC0807 family protein [Pseudonocardia phyllosphaerae]|uniref:VC0807 family protein n=1 Tax=Pseudonocardia phyllosphaerae TaxID=3390502 RepID=UPI00397ACEF1
MAAGTVSPNESSRGARPPTEESVGMQILGWVQLGLLTVVVPIVVYDLLTDAGVAPVWALIASSVGPLLDLGVTWLRRGRLDEFAVIVLILIGIGVLTSLFFDDPRLLMLKETVLTMLFGLVALGSLVLAPRPLMFYYGRRFATGGEPERITWWNGLWRYPGFRRTQMVLTAVWGVVFLAEGIARAVLTWLLPVDTMVVVNNVAPFVILVALVVWTILYARHAQRVGEARSRAAGEVPDPPIEPTGPDHPVTRPSVP